MLEDDIQATLQQFLVLMRCTQENKAGNSSLQGADEDKTTKRLFNTIKARISHCNELILLSLINDLSCWFTIFLGLGDRTL